MATSDGYRGSEDFDRDLWNEVCEDAECDDTRYHATVEELLQRIRDVNADEDVIDLAEDIVIQSELTMSRNELVSHVSERCVQSQRCECRCAACYRYCCTDIEGSE